MIGFMAELRMVWNQRGGTDPWSVFWRINKSYTRRKNGGKPTFWYMYVEKIEKPQFYQTITGLSIWKECLMCVWENAVENNSKQVDRATKKRLRNPWYTKWLLEWEFYCNKMVNRTWTSF